MLRVSLLTSAGELDAIAEEWDTLWREDAHASPFESPAWLVPWAHSFAANQPWTLAARTRDGALVALLPTCIYGRQLMLLGAGTSDYGGWLAHSSYTDAALAAFREVLRTGQTTWDTAHLTQLRTGSPLLALGTHEAAEACSRMCLGDGHTLSRKLRSNISYYRKRATALGEVRWRAAETPDQALDFLSLLVDLHSRRWQGQGESGVLADPQVLAHHRAAIPPLFRAGLLRIFTLSAGPELLGVAYALASPAHAAERNYYYYLMGFQPGHEALSPGTLLLAALRESALAEHAHALDLLRGDEPYKQLWGVEHVRTAAVRFTAASVADERPQQSLETHPLY
jgi:CelD/BcsL family acetyltransferase involved in cellulose biosynthesis